MRIFLIKDGLSMAYFRRRPSKELIHHSDLGSQYVTEKMQNMLDQCCYNAVVESFFHTLKTE
jgi:putative transposase